MAGIKEIFGGHGVVATYMGAIMNEKGKVEWNDASVSNTAIGPSTASRVPFLLSYTAAEAGHPKDFAKALETLRNRSGSALAHDEAPDGDELVDSFPMFPELFAAELFQLDVPQSSSSVSGFLPQVAPGSGAHEGLLRQRAAELIALLEGSAKSSSPHDIVTDFLTPTNLGLCLENFFYHAYRHVPIVHKASFEIASAELPLLLSILVVGAVWSYPRDTYFMALDTVELAERCIFESTLFRELQDPETMCHSARSTAALPLLQAATMLVSISFAFPNAEYRRRFREQRFPEMISVTRSLRLGSEKSSDLLTSTSFEWSDYIFRESCSRVVYYIYLLDCHISTLYAVLPRMPVLEMQAPLPSNELAFGSDNAEVCREKLFGDHAIPQLSLVDVVKSLMAVEHTSRDLCTLTAFPLFLAVGALQAMIFTAKTQLLENFQSAHFERALARWKEAWDLSGDARNSPKEVGFMVHAEEVWLLACKILKSDASSLIPRFGVNDMAQVRRWLQELD
ncbi:hypothetical protein E8E11_005577 [Didymella keratinophila]|nr:hypothetical protein E8E11_005577 [Didymella keratinophila]